VGAGAAVALSATAFTVWNQSNVNEKVYTVSLFTIALLSWLAFRWRDNLGRGKDDNLLLLMVFILALSVGNHLMAFLAAPALFVYILLVSPRTLTNWRLYAAAAFVAVLGLSIHLFLPLRASLGPVINEADPSTWEALWASLTRQQYDKPSIFANPIDPRMPRDFSLLVAQIGNYLQYFDWQWARSVAGPDTIFGGARPIFTFVFLLIGLYGAWTHYRRDRTSWAYVAVLFATLSAGLIIYLNFKYGYSYGRARFPAIEFREVRERDYFYIASFSVWGVWAGIGLAALWQRLAGRLSARPRPWTLASPVLAVALVPLVLNWSWASRANDYVARDWAYNLLMSVEPYAVLFTNGDNDTFPLWYLQEVEGIRRDVTVIVTSYLNTPWYVKQIRQLTTPCPPGVDPDADPTRIICQRPYRGEGSPELYPMAASPAIGDRSGQELTDLAPGQRPPTRSVFQLTDEQIDEIAATLPFVTRDPLAFRAGAIESTIPAGTIMIPADIFMTAIITAAVDDRPIYFASTTSAYEKLNLWDFLIRQGVAFKLNNGPVEEDPERGIVRIPESPLTPALGQHIDLPRTDALLWNVFMHRGGIPDEWTRWVDASTQGFPVYYAYTHHAAAQAHRARGNLEEAARHLERADAWLSLARR
ncbi:MAG TPA: DUF2723 domain-containing protein, partial [Longimicrobiales bacterium]|nr:DUF2723 domain-containing protein [Longimicrobiales bacterium]